MNYKTNSKLSSSKWKGYSRWDLTVGGHEALLIGPKTATNGKPWVWRAEFFDAFSYADMELLEQGWHIAYLKVSDMFGCPEAIESMAHFQTKVENMFGLSKKAVIFGFSRGGLYAFNYAAAYPHKVAGLYLDAPVLDILSWPAGYGSGCGSKIDWEMCLACYKVTEQAVKDFNENPLDKIPKVAQAGIPIIMVVGDADRVVPYSENGAILASKYSQYGGKIEVIVKHGMDHHPHSLEDPAPIIEFIKTYCAF